MAGVRGQPSHITLTYYRGRNIRVCAATNVPGLIIYRIIVALYNQTEFVQLLSQGLQQLSLSSKVFVMDNVHFHHSIEKCKSIIKSGMTIFNVNTIGHNLGSLQSDPRKRLCGLDSRIKELCIICIAK
ncbi:hypothetical protein RF11_14251 [Thelohanellus kitauei]|uniref:Tc1-like transposase DDE domain-containing protein n=1 Tax=Thelohanellus kitauei TaxID=669202 RepID=A0A0C2MD71_THEKT|nr:hypothetical protein RF11_14251 [Thelohanellus kitauei]